MRKKVTSVFIALLLVFGAASVRVTPAAAVSSEKISIQGHVYVGGDKTKPAVGVQVRVFCDGNFIGVSEPSDKNGFYGFWPTVEECPIGGSILVSANSDDKSGATSTTTHQDNNSLDIYIMNTVPIPEYGMIGGAIAVAAVIGIVVFMRRRDYKVGRV